MIGCVIQARTGSTRFPKKILSQIDEDCTVLEFLIEQLKNSKKIDKIVIATTNLEEDGIIAEHCKKSKLDFFQGDENDLVDRYYKCAKKFNFENIIRITSDCPLMDPYLVDEGIDKFLEEGCDYLTNSTGNFPHGVDFSIFKFSVLEKTWKNARLLSEKEHVIPYMEKNESNFNTIFIKNSSDQSKFRITLDWPEDLELLRVLVSKIKSRPILVGDVVKFLEDNLNLLEINAGHNKEEGYLKSLKNDKISNQRK
jgi:spore coat polysaccharide biosynthesis protein SpsF